MIVTHGATSKSNRRRYGIKKQWATQRACEIHGTSENIMQQTTQIENSVAILFQWNMRGFKLRE